MRRVTGQDLSLELYDCKFSRVGTWRRVLERERKGMVRRVADQPEDRLSLGQENRELKGGGKLK